MEGDTQFSDYLRRLTEDDKAALAKETINGLDEQARVEIAKEITAGTLYAVVPVSKRDGE